MLRLNTPAPTPRENRLVWAHNFETPLPAGESTGKETAAKHAKRTGSKAVIEETGHRIVGLLKTVTQKAGKFPIGYLRHLKVLKPFVKIGGGAAAIASELVFPNKANAANEKLSMQRSSILHQEITKRELPVEYVWAARRNNLGKINNLEKQKIIEAVKSANERIGKELPGALPFDLPS